VATDTHIIFVNMFSGLIPKEDSKGGRRGSSHLTDFSEIRCVVYCPIEHRTPYSAASGYKYKKRKFVRRLIE